MRSALVRALAANDLPGSAELLVQLAAIDVLNAGYLDHPRILGRLGQPLGIGGGEAQNYSSLVDLGHLQSVREPQRAWNQLTSIMIPSNMFSSASASTYWTSPSFSPSRENTSTPGSSTRYELGAPRSSIAETIAADLNLAPEVDTAHARVTVHHVALAVCDDRTGSDFEPAAVASVMIRK